MRKIEPQHHSVRVIKKFAWFPISIRTWSQGSKETRWLEHVVIEQKYYVGGAPFPFIDGWKNEKFLI
jgi:hypothetical protein